MGRTIKHVALSDIHLGNPNIPAHIIYNNFRKYVYPTLKNIDILTISGDFFDAALNLDTKFALIAISIIDDLKEIAIQEDFLIRVLRGTFSHDRTQLHFFNKNQDDNRVRVFSFLSYEYIKELDLKILYIPDDIPLDDLKENIFELFEKNNIKKVNIALTHGYYQPLLPAGLEKIIDSLPIEILDKVSNVICNGHIHVSSIYKNVLTIGSFERMAHGEESDKGFYILEYHTDKPNFTYTFIKNEEAFVFKTINVTFQKTHDDAVNFFVGEVKKVYSEHKRVFIRIISEDSLLNYILSKYCKNRFPNVLLTLRKNKVKKIQLPKNKIFKLPILTPDNISHHIKLLLAENFNIKETATRIAKTLEAFK